VQDQTQNQFKKIKKTSFSIWMVFLLLGTNVWAQNYNFNFSTNGRRVCLVESEVNLDIPEVTIKLLDYTSNTLYPTDIYKRFLYGSGSDWELVASGLPPGTEKWIDTEVSFGDVWEYQIKRQNSWTYNSQTFDATGYTIGSVFKDNTAYKGQMILLVADDIVNELPSKYYRLKKELTGDGWFVNELIVPKAHGWYSGDTVVVVKNQIVSLYNNAPAEDKPKVLFILGHVPVPRSGSSDVTAPDGHDQNKGARGFDAYYADIDGEYTDVVTYNPGGLQIPEAINMPGDFKWDQDFLSSDIEMAFGRVDFKDIDDYSISETQMMEIYLDKLSNYRNVSSGFEMGEKSGFYLGYDNSNDGTYRSLPNISKSENTYQNYAGNIHPQWVQENGPLKIYMQNKDIPNINEWDTYGMDATVFSSDQSYWGYNDCPQFGYVYSRIRALLASNTKCLVTLWTTSAVNTFFQSCSGDPLGFAVKETINYNSSNNNIERPEQEWDTEDWWNRTHLTYNGDPSICLYQIKPPSNLEIEDINGVATLSWHASTDENTMGYHIYKSDAEFGIYNQINASLITALSYIDYNYEKNDWYMIRAVKKMESGCGEFLQASLGMFIQGDFTLNNNDFVLDKDLIISPNPCDRNLTIQSNRDILSIELFSIEGKKVLVLNDINTNVFTFDLFNLNSGLYLLSIRRENGIEIKKMMVK
jgi:hypothetical protein